MPSFGTVAYHMVGMNECVFADFCGTKHVLVHVVGAI